MVNSLSSGDYIIKGIVPIWVDNHCVMRSPIAEPGILGDTIKIKALSREPGNTRWTVISVRGKLLFIGELDDIQFQPILQDIADDIGC